MGGFVGNLVSGAGDAVGNVVNGGLTAAEQAAVGGLALMKPGGALTGSIGDVLSNPIGAVKDLGRSIDQTVRDVIPGGWTTAALMAAGAYYAPEIGAWVNSSGAPVAAASDVAAADTAAGVAGSTGTGLTAGGSGLGLTAGNTANLATMGGAQGLTTAGATGGVLGATGLNTAATGALAGTLGYGLSGLGSAATGAGLGATGAGLGALGTAGLISGGLGLAGGLLGGSSAADAAAQAAQQYAQSAKQGAAMANFRPVGTTTTFGTSNFQFDPTTGQLTSAGYQLSPELQAYQNQIMGSNRQSLTDATNLQNLGRGYIAQSPEAAAQQWMANQQALLAPSRDVESARLANQLQQTGRTGVSVAQGGNLGAANPEQQALANARALQDLQLAAQAQQAGQAQTTFGQGLLSNAYQPFQAGLTTASNVEALGQQPFTLSSNLANLSSTAGARAGQILSSGMGNSITSQQAASSYNPWATALQGAASNPLTGLGLMNAFAK